MGGDSIISISDFEKVRALDTRTVSKAIERLEVGARSEGSIAGSALHCLFPHLPPMLGYAVTGRIRSTASPVRGRAYQENLNWWGYVASIPKPRVMVLEDLDDIPGAGALLGELHAVIGTALDCVGYVSNGSVRDLPAVEALGLHVFAGGIAVSQMYAHICEYGEPVEIGGLQIHPGSLIHGDRNGVHFIPLSIAPEIPRMAAKILTEESEFKEFRRSPGRSQRSSGWSPGR